MTVYLTRALARIEADDPIEAVTEYRRLLDEVPAEEWVYRVEEYGNGEMSYVFKGEVFTLTQLQDAGITPSDEEAERIRAAQTAAEEDGA